MSGNLNYRSEPIGFDSTHTLSHEGREAIRNTRTMRQLLEMLYRPRGLSRMSVDERDSYEGWHMEFGSWLQSLEQLGDQIEKDLEDQRRIERTRPEQELTPTVVLPSEDADSALSQVIAAWEALPGDTSYSGAVIQRWLVNDMKPAIDRARRVIAGSAA